MEYKNKIEKIIVIGDIHGCHKTLLSLLEKLPKDSLICCVGDLIDRGRDSYKVVNEIINRNILSVIGNHEIMMINALNTNNAATQQHWLYQGGRETLKSYDNQELVQQHLKFIKALPFIYKFSFKDNTIKPLIVSHSSTFNYLPKSFDSINLALLNDDEIENIIWNRDVITTKKLNMGDDSDYFNIFGHTILNNPIITDNYAAIDTGSFLNLNNYTKSGGITAIEYPTMNVYSQENIED